MLTKPLFNLCILLTLSTSTLAKGIGGCGGSGTFNVNDVNTQNNGAVTVGPQHVAQFNENTAQLCIVNRSPSDSVTITSTQVNDAVQAILNKCCQGETICSGGGSINVAGANGDTVDVAVQSNGQNCTP